VIEPVALPDVVHDRPTAHHHDPDDNLRVPWLAVAAVAVAGEL
jgi:hypothetical protein